MDLTECMLNRYGERMPRTIDLYFPNGRISQPQIAVENPTGSVEVGGYRVEVERRVVGGVASSAVRFSSPEGDVVKVCWRAGDQQHTAKGMLADLTTPQLARVFDKLSPAAEKDMTQRVHSVIDRVISDVDAGVEPGRIRVNMTWASLLLTQEDMDAYNAAAAPGALMPKQVALLRDNGIPPHLGAEFASRRSYGPESEYVKFGPYAQQGWTAAQYFDFCDAFRKTKADQNGWVDHRAYPGKGWARVPYEHALLGFRAQMKPTLVRRLIDTGKWDVASVEMLAALRT